MTALKLGIQDSHADVSSAALLALGETCAVLEVSSFLFFHLVSSLLELIEIFQGDISKYAVEILPTLMELMVKQENMEIHNLKVIRIYYAVEEVIGVLSKI